jgi:hypothetical protein
MGMDVYGKKPTAEVGKYFRRNVWGWRPLADLCLTLCPKQTKGDTVSWHTNDGHGLNAAGALALANALDAALKDGKAEAYIKIRNAEVALLPNERCGICNGTGIRTDGVGKSDRQEKKRIPKDAKFGDGSAAPHPRAGETGWCNACDGRGVNRPYDTWYEVDLEDVRQFADFLRASGGFEIC